MSEILVRGIGLRKHFAQGTSELEILRGVDIDVKAGESIGIVGSSGAGKSTLLHILGTLDRPNEGELYFGETNVMELSDEEVAKLRNREMGFVFQFHHLLAEFTAVENVMIPSRIAGDSKASAKIKALELLDMLGLAARADHFPNELSGGELQRVAIARALVRRPRLAKFADHPEPLFPFEGKIRTDVNRRDARFAVRAKVHADVANRGREVRRNPVSLRLTRLHRRRTGL